MTASRCASRVDDASRYGDDDSSCDSMLLTSIGADDADWYDERDWCGRYDDNALLDEDEPA